MNKEARRVSEEAPRDDYGVLMMPPQKHESAFDGHYSGDTRAHSIKFTYWQDGRFWLGYLREYPDYWTQGESLNDLKVHLLDLYHDLSTGKV